MDIINIRYYNLVRKSELISSIVNILDNFDEEELYLTGGILRNAIWNKLHCREEFFYLDDCDIIFYNDKIDKEHEREIENYLKISFPYLKWSVKNQARMHIKNGHLKYKNIIDAVYCFPETSSAIAINGKWDIIAPYGYHDILNLRLNPTNFCRKNEIHIFNKRISEKKWLQEFEQLTLYSFQQKYLQKQELTF